MNRRNLSTLIRQRCVWMAVWPGIIAVAAALAPAAALDAQPPFGAFVDFDEGESFTVRPMQAEKKFVAIKGGQALQITTEPTASWPGVLIVPRAKKWDLSGYDSVEVLLGNRQDVPVRVLLSVNNPGADGQHHCNTASVTVPRHGAAVLVVPFGTWHGEPGYPIDLKNIVSMQVFLDRPGRSHTFLVGNIHAVRFNRDRMKTVFADPFFQQLQPVFGRGVNFGDTLEVPKEANWGVVLKEEYFQKIKDAGFDSVRIPICWSAHADESASFRIDPKFFERVDWVVGQALKRRLTPIVNMHHYDGLTEEPDKHAERFLALWQQIAEHYKGYPPALALELLNEPHDKLTAEKWNQLLGKAIVVVRRTNPNRKIVVGPVGWNSINDLATLELPEEDRNLVVTVHYYNPFHFTHQGAGWVGPDSQKWLGTKWTGSKAEQQAILRDLDRATTWAVKHRRPLYLGEFGAYSKGDMESRARWTRFVADEAVRQKMGFGYWEFWSGFGVYDPKKNQWIEPLKDALLAQTIK